MMDDTNISFRELDAMILAGNTVSFKWRTRVGEMIASALPCEWVEWDQERREAFYSEMTAYSAEAWISRHASQPV